MKIDKRLNLVIPIEQDDGTTIYVHSMPISWQIFDKYFLVLSKVYAAFWSEGLSAISGPRIAAKMLKTVSQSTARLPGESWWDGDDGVEKGLMPEIQRLTNILMITPEGWRPRPLQEALDRKLLSEEEISEVLNQIVFFTVCSVVAPKETRERLIEGGAAMSNSQTTSLMPMDFVKSLPISTKEEDSGKKGTRSSAVSSTG